MLKKKGAWKCQVGYSLFVVTPWDHFVNLRTPGIADRQYASVHCVQFVSVISSVSLTLRKRGLHLPINVHDITNTSSVMSCSASTHFALPDLSYVMEPTVNRRNYGWLEDRHKHKTTIQPITQNPLHQNERHLPFVPLPYRRCPDLAPRTVNRPVVFTPCTALPEFQVVSSPSQNSGGSCT